MSRTQNDFPVKVETTWREQWGSEIESSVPHEVHSATCRGFASQSDSTLLRATDEAAPEACVGRSDLIREALRAHVRCIEIREMERREREAYRRHPQDLAEVEAWAGVAVWPED
jgi:hypothetical protein